MSQDDSNSEVASAELPQRLSRRSVLFVLGALAFAIFSLVLSLEFFVVERIPALTEAALTEAKKRWLQNGPLSYDMDIDLRGAQPGNIVVNVRKRVVMAETRDGKVPKEHTWETWSVPGLFNTIETDMEIAENPEQAIQAAPGTKWTLRCEFDPKLGIPLRYHRMVTGGPEVYWRVTRFQEHKDTAP